MDFLTSYPILDAQEVPKYTNQQLIEQLRTTAKDEHNHNCRALYLEAAKRLQELTMGWVR